MEGTAIGEGYTGPAPATGSAQGGQAGGQSGDGQTFYDNDYEDKTKQ